MKLQHHRRPETSDHPAGFALEVVTDGKKYKSKWYAADHVLTGQIKDRPGIPLFDKDGEKAAHLYLTQDGSYKLYKYAPPKPHINTLSGRLEFHEEVRDIDTAQDILNGFRHLDMPASCTHKHGLHQIYVKYNN